MLLRVFEASFWTSPDELLRLGFHDHVAHRDLLVVYLLRDVLRSSATLRLVERLVLLPELLVHDEAVSRHEEVVEESGDGREQPEYAHDGLQEERECKRQYQERGVDCDADPVPPLGFDLV